MINIIPQLNSFFEKDINIFSKNGYIRFNMLYFSPINFRRLKSNLLASGMTDIKFDKKGLRIEYGSKYILFSGVFTYTMVDGNILGFEFDFELTMSDDALKDKLFEMEANMKGLDTIFFMTYEVDIDEEIMNNPLCNSVDYMMRKIENRKNF